MEVVKIMKLLVLGIQILSSAFYSQTPFSMYLPGTNLKQILITFSFVSYRDYNKKNSPK
jgi:hypothetical protein